MKFTRQAFFPKPITTQRDCKSFLRAAKADLKRQSNLAGFVLIAFYPGCYDFSAFLRSKAEGYSVCVSINDVRLDPLWDLHVLCYPIADEKKSFCQWNEIGAVLNRMEGQMIEAEWFEPDNWKEK